MRTATLKTLSEEILTTWGIKVNHNLPLIEELEEVTTKTKSDVAGRLCALTYVIGLGYDADRSRLIRSLKKYSLFQFLTKQEEIDLFHGETPTHDIGHYRLLSESAQALAWCLHMVDLNHFDFCDDDLPSKMPFEQDPTDFIASANIRPIEEIQQQSDLLYRLHWSANNENLSGKISKVDPHVTCYRRRAIDWVYGTADDWDDVPIDT